MEAWAYASDFWHKCYILGKTPNRFGDIKIFYWGLGWDKKRLNVLYFANTNILFTLPPTLNKASESKESK